MTKMIQPKYMNNRAADNAYGCACVCNAQQNNYQSAKMLSMQYDACGCTCNDNIANRTANFSWADASAYPYEN